MGVQPGCELWYIIRRIPTLAGQIFFNGINDTVCKFRSLTAYTKGTVGLTATFVILIQVFAANIRRKRRASTDKIELSIFAGVRLMVSKATRHSASSTGRGAASAWVCANADFPQCCMRANTSLSSVEFPLTRARVKVERQKLASVFRRARQQGSTLSKEITRRHFQLRLSLLPSDPRPSLTPITQPKLQARINVF